MKIMSTASTDSQLDLTIGPMGVRRFANPEHNPTAAQRVRPFGRLADHVILSATWPKMTARDKAVWTTIAKHENPATGQTNPSKPTVATETGYSVATVKRAIVSLSGLGLLKVHRGSRPNGGSATNCYEVMLPGEAHMPVDGLPQGHAEPGGGLTLTPGGGLTLNPPLEERSLEVPRFKEPSQSAGARARPTAPAPPAKPSRELALAVIESWNQWARNEDRPTAQPTTKLTEKLMRRIGEGMTWDALAVELDRLSDFALGRTPKWNGVTLHWIAQNEENYTKLTCGNYRRQEPTETIGERHHRLDLLAYDEAQTIAQRHQRMTPRKEKSTFDAVNYAKIVASINLSPDQAARLRAPAPA